MSSSPSRPPLEVARGFLISAIFPDVASNEVRISLPQLFCLASLPRTSSFSLSFPSTISLSLSKMKPQPFCDEASPMLPNGRARPTISENVKMVGDSFPAAKSLPLAVVDCAWEGREPTTLIRCLRHTPSPSVGANQFLLVFSS